MKINEKKFNNVIGLSAPERYNHFIKVAADQRKVWGLYCDGWALYSTADGKEAFPLWPAWEYANACAKGEWVTYKAREIDLDTLLQILIPKLSDSKTLAAIFPTSAEKGITPDLHQIKSDISTELKKIE